MAASIALPSRPVGWLRNPSFDLAFVAGIALLSLLVGFYVVFNPSAFAPIFVVNGWLLGYHHVTSTYTRLIFDRDSIVEHRFLLTWLPLIVLASVIAASVGSWRLGPHNRVLVLAVVALHTAKLRCLQNLWS